MLRLRLFAGIILLGIVSVVPAPGEAAAQQLQRELIGADEGIWEAIARSPLNIDQVRARLAPDYIDIDSGVQHQRDEVLQYLRGLSKFSFHYEFAHAYVLSPTSGYVIAELSYTSVQNGTAAKGTVLTTTVYSKEQGRWVAHVHTETDAKLEKR